MRKIILPQSLRTPGMCIKLSKVIVSMLLILIISVSVFAQKTVEICPGDTVTLKTLLPYESIAWRDGAGNILQIPDAQGVLVADTTPKVSPGVSTTYVARIVDPAAVNLITTGDFESDTTWQNFSAYEYIPVPNDYVHDFARGFFTVVHDAQELFDSAKLGMPYFESNWYQPIKDHTTGSGRMFVANGSTNIASDVYKTSVNVTAGTEYIVGAWFANIHIGYKQPYSMQIFVDGSFVGSIGGEEVGGWYQQFDFWKANVTKKVDVVFRNITRTNDAGNDFAIDDVLFAPVTYDTITVNVKYAPQVTVFDTSACFGNGLGLIRSEVNSTLPIDSVVWKAPPGFLNDIKSDKPAMANNNQSEGKYYLTLTAYADNGCFTVSDNAHIAISNGPSVSIDNEMLCYGSGLNKLTVDISQYFPLNGFSWIVSDKEFLSDTTSLEPGLKNKNQAVGDYTVSLLLTDSVGCGKESKAATITIIDLPKVSVFDTAVCFGNGLSTINKTISVSKPINNVVWTAPTGFLNDINSINPVVANNNQAAGSYEISLAVYDSAGCIGISDTANIIINKLPVVTVLDTSTCYGAGTSFAIANVSSDAAVKSYAWSAPAGFFADTTKLIPELGINQTQNDYTVSLTVTDSNNCSATSIPSRISLGDAPEVTIHDTAACFGQGLDLINSSVISNSHIVAVNWSAPWLFLNDSTSRIPFMANSEQDTGTYVIGLAVIEANGCRGVGVGTVRIYGNPEVVLTDQQTKFGESITVQSTVIAGSDSTYKYEWIDPSGILNNITLNNPVLADSYLAIGEYPLTLKVTDANGCVHESQQVYVTVLEPDTVVIDMPKAFRPAANSENSTVYVKGFGITELKSFQVFNRWGNLIFESDDLRKGWDGHYKGKLLPSGAYGYQLTVETYDGVEHYRKGTILLLH